MKDKKVDKKEAKVGGLDFEVVVLSSSGDLSKKIAKALEMQPSQLIELVEAECLKPQR